jgi:hypothetical protein
MIKGTRHNTIKVGYSFLSNQDAPQRKILCLAIISLEKKFKRKINLIPYEYQYYRFQFEVKYSVTVITIL